MARNVTNRNKSKQARLSSEHVVPRQSLAHRETTEFLRSLPALTSDKWRVLYSLGRALCDETADGNPTYRAFTLSYDVEPIEKTDVPPDEPDLLGAAYQFLNTKAENLSRGSFYTGTALATRYVEDLDFSHGRRLLDPSCGSGAFLIAVPDDVGPEQVIGVDSDPTAVMCAKFNYFRKWPDAPAPAIYESDFFNWRASHPNKRFDYVVGNPPFGADLDTSKIASSAIESGESFSHFIEGCFPLLEEDGVLRFIVPEALLNVRRHKDVRAYILKNTNLTKIEACPDEFAGVMSGMYMIELRRGHEGQTVVFDDGMDVVEIDKTAYETAPNRIFTRMDEATSSVVKKIESTPHIHLRSNSFALGIVTGGNKEHLLDSPVDGSEPIYTGKEIVAGRYSFLPAKHHIVFDRSRLQQVAPDRMYRAAPKLVYKAISPFLRFVIDATGALTTNSANILVPDVEGWTVYGLLGFLNSRATSFYARAKFGGVNKVSKEMLMSLPIPVVEEEVEQRSAALARLAVEKGRDGDGAVAENTIEGIQEIVEDEVYALDEEERRRIAEAVPLR